MGRLALSPAPSAPPPEPRPQRPASEAPPGPRLLSGPSHATPPPGALPKEALGHPLGSRFCLPHSGRPRKGIFG